MTTFEAAYSNYNNPYSNPELEDEWETHEAHYNNPYSNPELEDEGEYFFNLSSIGKGLKLLAKAAAC